MDILSLKKSRYILHLCSIFVAIIVAPNVMFAQNDDEEMFYIANDYVDSENFENAIRLYKRVLDEEPDDPKINFKLGFCYLNTSHKKDQAIKYIKKSVDYYEAKRRRRRKKKLEYLESSFYLAKAYQANYKFDTAIEQYNKLKKKVTSKKLLGIIDNEIMACAKSKALLDKTLELKIYSLGNVVNSEYSDHSPFVSADDSLLMFTSRRANKYNKKTDEDGEYDENIYVSYKNEDGSWSEPKDIGTNINTGDHEAVIGLSVDGQKLFIYKSEDRGSIYTSTLDGDVWSKPKKLDDNINTRYRETHASLSSDGKILYFTSDRKGGYGGLDIYCAYKQKDGTWGNVKNLGPEINTEEDERAPYIHPDGVTLFFSTKGHGGLGGFDIFTSQLNEAGKWTKPENIGYPVNTSSDDIYYIGTAGGRRSYYTSSQKGGLGSTDLYCIDFNKSKIKHNLSLITGKVKICRGSLPPVTIKVLNAETNDIVGTYKPNSKTGKFLFVLKQGKKYKLIFEVNNETIKEEEFNIAENSPYKQPYRIVEIPASPPCDEDKNKNIIADNVDSDGKVYDSNIKISNILFPTNQIKFGKGNKSLDDLAKYLINNPNAVIEVGSYADAKGRASYNYQLSKKRANAVRNYLIRLKVNPKQVVAVAYGEENPIALNKNKNGTWNETGTKFNRRIEFKIIKQGKTTLLIKPIRNIPEDLINKNYDKNYIKNTKKHIEIKI